MNKNMPAWSEEPAGASRYQSKRLRSKYEDTEVYENLSFLKTWDCGPGEPKKMDTAVGNLRSSTSSSRNCDSDDGILRRDFSSWSVSGTEVRKKVCCGTRTTKA